MKKTGIMMAIVLAAVIALGCYNRQSYLSFNWEEESVLDDFTVGCCNEGDFEPYYQEEEPDYDGSDDIVFDGTEWQSIEVTTEDSGRISYIMDTSDEQESVLVDPKQEFMDALSEADYVLKVTCEGKLSFSAGMSIQEVSVTETCRGEESLDRRTIRIVSEYRIISAGAVYGNVVTIGGYTNLMKEGEEYLLFCNDIGSSELFMEASQLSYFALADVENVISESVEPLYAELKENEFFAEDQETLDILLEMKQAVLEEFGF